MLPPSPARAAEADARQQLTGTIDKQIEAAAHYLVEQQAKDGAWRTDRYPQFKAGEALTSLVVRALGSNVPLRDVSDALESSQAARARRLGRQYLVRLCEPPATDDFARLDYPLYVAANTLMVLPTTAGDAVARERLVKFLIDRQLAGDLGWSEADPQFGGWGYATEAPRKPTAGRPLSTLAQPNLSATAFALEALRAAGLTAADPIFRRGLAFVERLQNYPLTDAADAERAGELGGFYFVLDDPTRNKAGHWGEPANSRPARFRSYGSATADGVRALLACGAAMDAPRLVAARHWLTEHFAVDRQAGGFPAARKSAQASYFFYYCWSAAEALRKTGGTPPPARWAAPMARALIDRQQPDGSWQNAAVDGREDEPLVATAFGLMALAACRDALDPR